MSKMILSLEVINKYFHNSSLESRFIKTSVIQIPRCYKSGRIVRRLLQCYDVEDSSKKIEFSTVHFSTFVFLNP